MSRAFLNRYPIILGEGSMYERLRRDAPDSFDPHIAYAGMLYDETGRDVLEATYREYVDVAQQYGLPMVVGTPTWRANASRIAQSRFASKPVNKDAFEFMAEMRHSFGAAAAPILIAGSTGPAGDGYKPEEAPDTEGAMAFHEPQISALAATDIDIFRALTLPSFGEALGIAKLLAQTTKPYILSFVIRRDGTLLDGTDLDVAIDRIDNGTEQPPAHYNINCVHASVFANAINSLQQRSPNAAHRVAGIDANTSAKSPEELDGLTEIDTEAPEQFARHVSELHKTFGISYLAGCCGTSTEHISELAKRCVEIDSI